MADISAELEVIQNERRGRLVKDAIHDALDKLNQTANRRPTALKGIPIGEAIIDTGWIDEALIGRIGAGEIREFDGVISEGGVSSSIYSARARMDVSDPGRVFLVVMPYSRSGTPELTNISGDVNWELIDCQFLETYSYDADESGIHTTYPDATLKGYVYSRDELPSLDDVDVGDMYVDNAHRKLCICDEVASEKVWDYRDDPAGQLNVSNIAAIYIWSAVINTDTTIDVRVDVDGTSMDPKHLSVGLFAIYNKDNFAADTLPYHVSVIDYGKKAFDTVSISEPVLKAHFKGKVAAVADLPSTLVIDGDIYYVTATDACYQRYTEDGESGWSKMGNVYDSSEDSVTVTHDPDGIHAGTSRIFVCAGYNPNTNQGIPHLLYTDGASVGAMTPVAYSLAGGSYLSAWHQVHGDSSYPIFKPAIGVENYVNLYDGSVAVLVIEIGSSLEGGDA